MTELGPTNTTKGGIDTALANVRKLIDKVPRKVKRVLVIGFFTLNAACAGGRVSASPTPGPTLPHTADVTPMSTPEIAGTPGTPDKGGTHNIIVTPIPNAPSGTRVQDFLNTEGGQIGSDLLTDLKGKQSLISGWLDNANKIFSATGITPNMDINYLRNKDGSIQWAAGFFIQPDLTKPQQTAFIVDAEGHVWQTPPGSYKTIFKQGADGNITGISALIDDSGKVIGVIDGTTKSLQMLKTGLQLTDQFLITDAQIQSEGGITSSQKLIDVTFASTPVEQLPATQIAMDHIISAFSQVNITITPDQPLLQRKISGKDGKTYTIAYVHIDPDPKKNGEPLEGDCPVMINTGEGWREPALNEFAQLFFPTNPISIGVGISAADNNKDLPSYSQTVKTQFGFVHVSDETMQRWWVGNKFDRMVSYGVQKGLGVKISKIFFNGDTYQKDQNVDDYMQARFRQILPSIQKNKGKVPFVIVLGDEPFFTYQGKVMWQGENPDPSNPNPTDALVAKYGRDWIIHAYKAMFDTAKEFGLEPGVDFNVIGITLPGAELPGTLNTYLNNEVVREKKAIAAALGISWETVPFDIGESFQLGENDPSKQRLFSIPSNRADLQTIIQTLQATAKVTNSPIHMEDMDIWGSDTTALAQEISIVVEAAVRSGVVPDITLFNGVRFGTAKDAWPTDPIFLPPTHDKSVFYYAILTGLLRASSSPAQ